MPHCNASAAGNDSLYEARLDPPRYESARLRTLLGPRMKIRFGYEMIYTAPQPVPMILMLHAHPSRTPDLLRADQLSTEPIVPLDTYIDGFGNTCTRIVAPAGGIRLTADGLIRDSGLPDPTLAHAQEHPVESLPHDALVYLLGSRYCETERLMNDAWRLFGHMTPGWSRVQAVCDFAHQHIDLAITSPVRRKRHPRSIPNARVCA